MIATPSTFLTCPVSCYWLALIDMDWSVVKYWDCCADNLDYLNDKRCYFYQRLESVCDFHNLSAVEHSAGYGYDSQQDCSHSTFLSATYYAQTHAPYSYLSYATHSD